MLKQFYKGVRWSLLLLLIGACSSEEFEDELLSGKTPIHLSAGLTRAVGDDPVLITSGNPLAVYQEKKVPFFLSARTVGDQKKYFSNMLLNIGGNQSEGRNKLLSKVYYPLGKHDILLYAHTGKKTTDKDSKSIITLTSGTNLSNDVLRGQGTNDTGNAVTFGDSENPIKYITFNHVMTQVTVKIEVDEAVEDQKPKDIRLTFKNNAMVGTGSCDLYDGSITVPEGQDDYMLTGNPEGITHYLVPTGKIISGTDIINRLVIDDYVATQDDLKALTLPKAVSSDGTESDFKLDPGLSYTLVFQIKRLKIVGIKLELRPWSLIKATASWDYDPYRVPLNIKGYDDGVSGYDATKTGNPITKMVLKADNGSSTYQYIGTGKLDDAGSNPYIDFVTLPKGDLSALNLSADLYTKEGLLIRDVEVTSSGTNLEMKLSENGLKRNTENVYEITTPVQFALMLNNPQTQRYRLMNDIDMDNTFVELAPATFPSGAELDGNQYSILHLQTDRTQNYQGLIPTNRGVLKNLRIASGTISGKGRYFGGICGANYGTIEGCINEANIVPSALDEEEIADYPVGGGICGENHGTILACLNTGNILSEAVKTTGGICGTTAEGGTIKACLSVGLLNGMGLQNTSLALSGGVSGRYTGSDKEVVHTCFWLTGTTRKEQGVDNETVIAGIPAETHISTLVSFASDLAPETIRSQSLIDELSGAAGPDWKFEMDPLKSSWPIPVPVP